MSQPIQPSQTTATVPQSSGAPVPIWLIVLMFVLLFWGAVYFDMNGGWFDPKVYGPYKSVVELEPYQPKKGGIDLGRGKATYDSICALCHGPTGEGKPGQAPPLAGSEWVAGSPNRLIRIPLTGLTGPIQVKGQEYTGMAMTAMGAALSNEDLASVLSYIRQAFGNNAAPITPEQVTAIRVEIKNRPLAYTVEELKKLPE